MKQKLIFSCLIFLFLLSCKEDFKKITSVKSYDFNELKPLLTKNDDKIYVVNFWATWCGPCVKELPYFERINQEYAGKKVEVLLVSLDFPKQVEKRLIPFINKKKLQSKVILLDDVDEDFWIKAIDSNWSGALPATIIYNKSKRKFYEQSFSYETLEKELITFLNP
ncbi:TlpA family protein disulfide reductase [Polaribacter aquimarinus]|uniref:Thioredoxin n=1 Tax=Polaribacter aquimarinus TaxID=2100726 RepID=A0A2U2JAD5_9FLAO|nr:TlpA family protein disulfide reductase [Polaribacter aquimarinus]PWG05290.1 thioredoxin [Polaribacter aquimarinus]